MEKIVLALGFFDGIHLGHAALMEKTVARAKEYNLTPAVFTFDRHPKELITGQPVPLICSPLDRQELLQRLFGIRRVYAAHFDQEMMHMHPEDFVEKLLVEQYHVAHVVAGHDYHFGYRNEGTPELLQTLCQRLGLGCDIIPRVTLEGITVSSTYIRGLLEKGEMEQAQRFLGHPYSLSGTVEHGQHLGTKLGVPTVNLPLPEGVVVPEHGVYCARVFLPEGGSCPAVTNVGLRPTVNSGRKPNTESYLLDFSGDLYGQPLRLELYHRLRPEKKFDSLAQLQAQLQRDIEAARAYFA